MLARTITLKTNPATQMTLYYVDRETLAKKESEQKVIGNFISIDDDFGTTLVFAAAELAMDTIIDNMQTNYVKANSKIDEITAAKQFSEFLKENPELKQMLEVYEARQRQGQMPPQTHGQGRRGRG